MSPGIPDTNACLNGLELWLEGKFLKDLPARETTLIQFGNRGEDRLIHQCNWLTARRKAGGKAFWWVRVRDANWYLFGDKFNWLKDGVRKDIFLQQPSFTSAKLLVEDLIRRTS